VGQAAGLELGEELADGSPFPLHQVTDVGRDGHSLDRSSPELVAQRRGRDAAVACYDGGDSLADVRRGKPRTVGERQQPVVVGVDIDEAGRHDPSADVEHRPARGRLSDLGDQAVFDQNVRPPPRRAGPVDDRAAAQREGCRRAHRPLLS
jgi:hypothetical protein